jgi:hypothetical protein
MEKGAIGFAFRYNVFSPSEVREAVGIIDQDGGVCPVFIPDGRSGYESIEVVSSILSRTKHVRSGSGVIRLLEHDPNQLARRLQTIQAYSSNRCLLGVGTGSPGSNPSQVLDSFLGRLEDLMRSFRQFPTGIDPPECWVAALRMGIGRRVMNSANGLLLNFCTPHHISRLIKGLGTDRPKGLQVGCYLKLFYSSKGNDNAKRLMIQEFLNYDSIPQYHQMFQLDGTADALVHFKRSSDWHNNEPVIPDELFKVSLANPTLSELREYVETFREAGLDLPVIYPYFPEDEVQAFKLETVKRTLDLVG